MFKNAFQYGNTVTLLNIQDKDTIKKWLVSGSIKKAYDRSVKGYVYMTDMSSKLQLPKDGRKNELYLLQPYLCLQVKVLNKQQFHVEIVFSDQVKQKKRLIFYSGAQYAYSKDNISRQPMHARIPCGMILEGVWLNLQLDIQSFVDNCFDATNFRSIDAINIQGAALVRRVFTCKTQVPDSFPYVIEREFGHEQAQGYEDYVLRTQKLGNGVENVPSNLEFGSGVDHMNQVLSYDRLIYFGYIFEESGLLSNNMQTSPTSKKPKPQVAFGARAIEHKEIRSMQDELVQNFHVSPTKIRKAGVEEMERIKQEEMLAQSRSSQNRNQRSISHKNLNMNDILGRHGIMKIAESDDRTMGRGQSQVIKSEILKDASDRILRRNTDNGTRLEYGEVPISEDFGFGQKETSEGTHEKGNSLIQRNALSVVKKSVLAQHKQDSNIDEQNLDVGLTGNQNPSRYRIAKPLLSPQNEQLEAKRINTGGSKPGPIQMLNQMDAQRRITQQNANALVKLSPLQNLGQKTNSLRVKNQGAPLNLRRPVDDQTINNRLRELQDQKREIAQLAQKYELQDNSQVEQLSLLTIFNPKMGHHHGPKFGEGGLVLENQERKARLAEYHKMTNERRKEINQKVQKKKNLEQKEIEAKLAEEQRENKVKLERAAVVINRKKQRKQAKKEPENDQGINEGEKDNSQDLSVAAEIAKKEAEEYGAEDNKDAEEEAGQDAEYGDEDAVRGAEGEDDEGEDEEGKEKTGQDKSDHWRGDKPMEAADEDDNEEEAEEAAEGEDEAADGEGEGEEEEEGEDGEDE